MTLLKLHYTVLHCYHILYSVYYACRLPPTSETKLQLIYKRSVRNSTDPFKKAVYCVLACCEVLEDHREVCNKTEDYMWLKVRERREKIAGR